jgi:hypothetical protein
VTPSFRVSSQRMKRTPPPSWTHWSVVLAASGQSKEALWSETSTNRTTSSQGIAGATSGSTPPPQLALSTRIASPRFVSYITERKERKQTGAKNER